MTTPTFAQLSDPTQSGPGFPAESYPERLLTILSMLGSGQNPDGTLFPGPVPLSNYALPETYEYLVGTGPGGPGDWAPAINAAFLTGLVVWLSGTYIVKSPIIPQPPGWWFTGGIINEMPGASGPALICNALTGTFTPFSAPLFLVGPGWITTSSTAFYGNIFRLYTNNLLLNMNIDGFGGPIGTNGKAAILAGDNIGVYSNTLNPVPSTGNGGIRYVGGDGFWCFGHVESGDDSLMFNPIPDTGNELHMPINGSISNAHYIGVTGASTNARFLIAALDDTFLVPACTLTTGGGTLVTIPAGVPAAVQVGQLVQDGPSNFVPRNTTVQTINSSTTLTLSQATTNSGAVSNYTLTLSGVSMGSIQGSFDHCSGYGGQRDIFVDSTSSAAGMDITIDCPDVTSQRVVAGCTLFSTTGVAGPPNGFPYVAVGMNVRDLANPSYIPYVNLAGCSTTAGGTITVPSSTGIEVGMSALDLTTPPALSNATPDSLVTNTCLVTGVVGTTITVNPAPSLTFSGTENIIFTTTVTAISGSGLTLSNAATASVFNETLNFFAFPHTEDVRVLGSQQTTGPVRVVIDRPQVHLPLGISQTVGIQGYTTSPLQLVELNDSDLTANPAAGTIVRYSGTSQTKFSGRYDMAGMSQTSSVYGIWGGSGTAASTNGDTVGAEIVNIPNLATSHAIRQQNVAGGLILGNRFSSVSGASVSGGIQIDASSSRQTVALNDFSQLATPTITNSATSGDTTIFKNRGINPKGKVTAPAFPASTASVTNTTGYDLMVVIVNGTGVITAISIGGNATGLTVPASTSTTLTLPAGQTFSPTYGSGTPTWEWFAN